MNQKMRQAVIAKATLNTLTGDEHWCTECTVWVAPQLAGGGTANNPGATHWCVCPRCGAPLPDVETAA